MPRGGWKIWREANNRHFASQGVPQGPAWASKAECKSQTAGEQEISPSDEK